MLWKELSQNKEFKLRWRFDEHNIKQLPQCMQIRCLTDENMLSPFIFDINSVPYNIKEGEEDALKINVQPFGQSFLIWKEKGELKAKYEGRFNDVDFHDPNICNILKCAPKFVKFECCDSFFEGNLVGHAIVSKGLNGLVKFFINPNNVTRKNKLGITPLHVACLYNHLDTVK